MTRTIKIGKPSVSDCKGLPEHENKKGVRIEISSSDTPPQRHVL